MRGRASGSASPAGRALRGLRPPRPCSTCRPGGSSRGAPGRGRLRRRSSCQASGSKPQRRSSRAGSSASWRSAASLLIVCLLEGFSQSEPGLGIGPDRLEDAATQRCPLLPSVQQLDPVGRLALQEQRHLDQANELRGGDPHLPRGELPRVGDAAGLDQLVKVGQLLGPRAAELVSACCRLGLDPAQPRPPGAVACPTLDRARAGAEAARDGSVGTLIKGQRRPVLERLPPDRPAEPDAAQPWRTNSS